MCSPFATLISSSSELASIKEHQMWDVVDYSSGMKPITCKWVLSDKFDAHGNFERKKARLVARGFQQPAESKKTKYAPEAPTWGRDFRVLTRRTTYKGSKR